MQYVVFLPEAVGLANRKLFCCLSILILLFSFFISAWEIAVSYQDGNMDLSGQTINITFGGKKSCQYPYAGRIDLHLGRWLHSFLIVAGAFCGMSLLPSRPVRPSRQKSWL